VTAIENTHYGFHNDGERVMISTSHTRTGSKRPIASSCSRAIRACSKAL
jgi:hypothetical protein